MARASTPTLLPLDTYAEIMGIPLPHFNQATGGEIFPVKGSCSSVWYQHSWQRADQVSREDLAREILDAEYEVARVLGYWPAPTWIESEKQTIPRFYYREMVNRPGDVQGMPVGLLSEFGRFISHGRRATTLIATATTAGGTLVYSDADGDGFDETATIVLPTTLTDKREIKVYFNGKSAAEDWEIRPARSITISGGNVTIVLWSWQLVDPDLWEFFPTDDTPHAIDASDSTNLVTSVDVYREYNDATEPGAVFYWNSDQGMSCGSCGGAGCAVCLDTTQEGCLYSRDPNAGYLIPYPAAYDVTSGSWLATEWTKCQDPRFVELNYYAGERSKAFMLSNATQPMPDYLARAIAYLATARLERDLCQCGAAYDLARQLRRDFAEISRENGRRILNRETLENPFGTRFGEIEAWRKLRKFVEKRGKVAII